MSASSYNSADEFFTVVQYGSTEEEVSDYLDTKLGPKGELSRKDMGIPSRRNSRISQNTETGEHGV